MGLDAEARLLLPAIAEYLESGLGLAAAAQRVRADGARWLDGSGAGGQPPGAAPRGLDASRHALLVGLLGRKRKAELDGGEDRQVSRA